MTETCRGCEREVVTDGPWVVRQPSGEHLHLECWVRAQSARETATGGGAAAGDAEFVLRSASPFLRARSAV